MNCLGVEFNGKIKIDQNHREDNYGIIRFGSGVPKNNLGSISNASNLKLGNFTAGENKSKNDMDILSSTVNKSLNFDIDYQLNEDDNIYPRHFDIRFDFFSESYYIKNYKNSAVFLRIDNKQVRYNYKFFKYFTFFIDNST